MNKKKGISNRRLLITSGLLGISLLVTALCGLVFFYIRMKSTMSSIGAKDYNTYKNYYVIISDNSDTDYWKSIYRGAQEEAQSSDSYVELMGEDLDKSLTKNDLIRIAINSGVDGILIEGDDNTNTQKLLLEAEKQGIPVVTVSDDNINSPRKSFIGVGSYDMGKEYGEQVVEFAKNSDEDKVDVMVLIDDTLTGNSQSVIMTAISETVINNGLVNKVNIASKVVSSTKDYAAEEEIRDIFVGQDDLPDVIVCLSEKNTICVYQTVVDYNKVGEVEILGYYMSPTIRAAIEKNIIHSTIVVDTQQMGRYSVEALNDYRESGYVNSLYLIDTRLVDADNITSFINGGDADD